MRRIVGLLSVLVLLSGCAASGGGSGAPSTSPLAPSASPTTLPIHITLAKGKVDPNGERVAAAKGTHLVLTIDSDRDDEVHVHGYDVEIPVTPGATVTKEIVLDQVGRFEVESHEPQFTILELTVS